MGMKLRVLHGTLRRQHGGAAGAEVKVRGKRFVIGSGMDCQLRCPSSSISPHHCEIVAEQEQYVIRDLASESGTFVNGERLEKSRRLGRGDSLRLGRLEFEVVIEEPVPPPPPKREDPVGDRISEMLVEADNEARAQRLEDPARRSFEISAQSSAPVTTEPVADVKKKAVVPPQRKPPMKLPPPPRVVADSTVEAAEEVLKKFFEKPKK
jgi:pSer/pThr/pTyr-binding forkhead associated (FHA) protein